MQEATRRVLRRITLLGLVRQVGLYQPTSYEDAADMKQTICDILDKEILKAADRGDSDVYLAFRRLKAGVVIYLVQAGADLSVMQQVEAPEALPVSVWSYRLYQDTGRLNQLINQTDPTHPAFMPTNFKALSR